MPRVYVAQIVHGLLVLWVASSARAQTPDAPKAPAKAEAPSEASAPSSTLEASETPAAPADRSPPVPREYGAVASATRLARPLAQLPASVTLLTREEIARNPTLTTDSLLRTLPSVSTFRRSTSLSADPSSQGLTLRGIGPSGVSRALVLLDGVPVNDPFAGSVYFRALPRLGLERVEVVPGGGSALYGSSALSGVVQLISRDSRVRALDADLSYGVANTLAASARVAGGSEQASASLEADWLRSDGFRVVAPYSAGPIDSRAASEHGSLNGRARFAATRRLSITPSLSVFRQELHGATRFTSASAELATGAVRADYDGRSRGRVSLLLFGRLARFEQSRARVFPARSDEALAATQRVPAHDQGASLIWSSRDLGAGLGHVISVGSDVRHARGVSRERLYPTDPSAPRRRDAGGQQVLLGAFAQDLYRVRSWLELDSALRVDYYRNYAGEQRVLSEAIDTRNSLDARDAFAVSPRVGVLVDATAWLRARASAYRSFRAPTLNELYRPFQVGTVLTAANARLDPERLTGLELGLESVGLGAITLRSTGFWNRLEDPITNATLRTPRADGTTRERQNLQLARVSGLELSAEWRIDARWAGLLAYTFVDARVVQRGPVAGVTGKRLAQDPVHRASLVLLFDDPALFRASLQLRFLGRQYEDDLNTLRMGGYTVVDALVSRQLFWRVSAFAAAENLLDQTYLVGRAGVDTVGTPFLARVGLSLREAL